MADLAVVILTYNEERHIGRALDNVSKCARRIYVIDSHSTDRTIDIARRNPRTTILQNNFVNYATQFQWALDNIETECAWLLRLDADELLEEALVEEIEARLHRLPSDVVGINLNRKHIFLGRWIRHGGRYPLSLLRIWRRGHGRIESRWMDEHIIISGGRSISFQGAFSDYNLNDLGFFTEKHNKYATREVIDRLNDEYFLFQKDTAVSTGSSSVQARVKRRFKTDIYNRMPLLALGPVLYFLWRYIGQLGFLDGKPGLIYHFLQGFWYRFLVEAMLYELRSAVAHLESPAAIKAELSRLTGLSIK